MSRRLDRSTMGVLGTVPADTDSAAQETHLIDAEGPENAQPSETFQNCTCLSDVGDDKSPDHLRLEDGGAIIFELFEQSRLLNYFAAGMRARNVTGIIEDDMQHIEVEDLDEFERQTENIRILVDELHRRQRSLRDYLDAHGAD